MRINMTEWKEFSVEQLFFVKRGKTLSLENKSVYVGDIPCINGSSENNGVFCYLSENITENKLADTASLGRNQFITDGILNMDLVMEKFMIHFTEIYGDAKEAFVEENGRRFFLLYLKPIINGVGNYYVEARTRDMRRTDVIVDYRGIQ